MEELRHHTREKIVRSAMWEPQRESRDIDEYFDHWKSLRYKYHEMFQYLSDSHDAHLTRHGTNYYTWGNDLHNVMRERWNLAPIDAMSRLMLLVIGKPIAVPVRSEEILSSLNLLLVMAQRSRLNIIQKCHAEKDPHGIAFCVMMTYLADLCVELLPSIIAQLKDQGRDNGKSGDRDSSQPVDMQVSEVRSETTANES